MNKKDYCVIMAGGVGSRFWPVSTSQYPKQFIDILGVGKSLLQLTFERFKKILPEENILVVTSQQYSSLVEEQLDIDKKNILNEPLRRNTAPCISYANFVIQSRTKDANIVVTPADHLIIDDNLFINNISDGLAYVKNRNVLLTIGIKPHRPDTGYGYIQLSHENNDDSRFNVVKTFTEKPDLKMAKFFVESGEFLWNSGIFIWSANSLVRAMKNHLPEVYNLFEEGNEYFGTVDEDDFINRVYPECKNISIDYGVMEKADNVYTLAADFGWSDLGTWKSLYDNKTKDSKDNVNIGSDKIITNNTHSSLISVPKDKVAVVRDLDNYIVVDSGDALLISKFENEQEIKEIVNKVKRKFGEDKA